MAYSPTLNKIPISTENIRYGNTYKKEYINHLAADDNEAHIHGFYELYVNISGDVSFLVNNHIYPIQKGDIIFTRPEDVHLCLYHSSGIHEHFCLWLDVPKDSPLVSFCYQKGFHNYISVNDEEKKKLFEIINNISKREDAKTPSLLQTCSLFQMMEYIESHMDDANNHATIQPPEEMQKILNYLNQNYQQIHYINEIYDKFYVSPATLTRWFRKYIHLSPKEFLESKKFAQAKTMLREGYTVTETSIQTGFASSSYFISVFKKRFGVTPYVFKQEMLN